MLILALCRRGHKRRYGSPRRKVAATIGLLAEIYRGAGLDLDARGGLITWLSVLLGFFFLLRSSEYLRKGSSPDDQKCLRVRNIYSLVEGVTLTALRMLIAMRLSCFTSSVRTTSWDKALAITSSGAWITAFAWFLGWTHCGGIIRRSSQCGMHFCCACPMGRCFIVTVLGVCCEEQPRDPSSHRSSWRCTVSEQADVRRCTTPASRKLKSSNVVVGFRVAGSCTSSRDVLECSTRRPGWQRRHRRCSRQWQRSAGSCQPAARCLVDNAGSGPRQPPLLAPIAGSSELPVRGARRPGSGAAVALAAV